MAPSGGQSREEVRENIRRAFGINPCLWQVEAAMAQMSGRDVVLTAPTGMGKTLAFQAPLCLDPDRSIIIVSPLTALSQQHAEKLNSLGFPSVALFAGNDLAKKIEIAMAGGYRAVILSPEILNSSTFQKALQGSKLIKRCKTIVIDEAHTMKDWAGFRSDFPSIPFIRLHFQKISVFATSATLTQKEVKDLTRNLLMDPANTDIIRRSNDRPNMKWIVTGLKYAHRTFRDVLWLADPRSDLKFLCFHETRRECEDCANTLREHAGEHHADRITWYHSILSEEARSVELRDLKIGLTRGICCTDSLGMGIDLPDINVVVQYGNPSSMTSLVQRMGRGARDFSKETLAIVLVDTVLLPPDHRPPQKRKRSVKTTQSEGEPDRNNT